MTLILSAAGRLFSKEVIIRSVSFWRTVERELNQRRIKRALELGERNLEKFRADFEREAHQNSKNKAPPRQRLQYKEAPQFRGETFDFTGTIR